MEHILFRVCGVYVALCSRDTCCRAFISSLCKFCLVWVYIIYFPTLLLVDIWWLCGVGLLQMVLSQIFFTCLLVWIASKDWSFWLSDICVFRFSGYCQAVFARVVVPTYTPTVWELWLLCVFPNNCLLHFSHAGGCIVISHGGWTCISLVSNEVELLLMCLLEHLAMLFCEVPIQDFLKWACVLFPLVIYGNSLHILARLLCQILTISSLILWLVFLLP